MKKLLYIILLASIINISQAQQLPVYNQYLFNPASLFPAYSGFNKNIETFITLQQRMLGFPGAPKLANFYLGGYFSNKAGYSIDITTLGSGNFTQNFFKFSYAYFIKLSQTTYINVALTPTVYSLYLNIANVSNFGATIDPVLNNSNNVRTITGDIGFSVALHTPSIDIAVSLPQTIGLRTLVNRQVFTLDRTMLVRLGYKKNISKIMTLEPVVLGVASQSMVFDIYGGLKTAVDKRLYASILYSYNGALSFSIGGIMNKNLFVGYSYDFGITGLTAHSGGSHTLNIGFLLKRSPDNREPSVFPLRPESDILRDVEQKLDNLNRAIQIERQNRQREDRRLNGRIDSLIMNMPANRPQTDTNTNAYNPQPQAPGWVQKIISPTIQFGLNSARILPSSYPELDKYVKLLQDDPMLKIKIVVHTDNLGSPSYKKKLSEARAKAIADYILSKPGVDKSQVFWEGRGGAEPIASNSTLEGRRKNNRVEIMFNKKIMQ